MFRHNFCVLHILILVTFGAEQTSTGYYWRDYRNVIPEDAISSEGIYIAQIPYNGLLPASFYSDSRNAVTECNGRKLSITQGIKLLCDDNSENFYWDYVNVKRLTGENLNDLVIGGTEVGDVLYIGKVYHEGEWKIGKVFPPASKYKGFRGWYNNDSKLYPADDFQILKYKPRPVGNVVSN